MIPVNGIASFPNISLDKTGTGYTIRAGVTGLIPDTSAAFNITPGAANKLVFGVQPSNAVAGVAIAPAVTVRVLDVNDNLVNSTAPVTLAISTNPGGATLTGGGPIAAVAGTATFPALSLNRSGVGYVLTATSGSLTATTSTGFNITHGAASALVWTVQPTNGTAGSALAPTPQVTVRDNLGNTVTGFAGTITVTIGNNPGAATLTGGTPSNLANGVADFAFLSLNRPGNGYTLIASAGGTPPNVTSAAFNIVAGTGNQLVFLAQPNNDTVGKAMTPAVQVAVQDAQGNTVTAATNSITLVLNLNPAGAVITGNTVSAAAGIATFSNLRLDKASVNPYNLIATSAGLISSPNSSLFTIDRAPTTATITTDTPDPSVAGQPYTVSYTVVATAPASGTPTGSVTVSDGTGASCVSVAPSGSCQLISTTAGAKNLTASYAGDANYVATVSAAAAHTVNPAATLTTITGDTPDPSAVGQAFAVSYTVSVSAPGAGTATGNVTVSDGTGATCVGTVAAGTCSLASTTTGNKTLTATYATDGNFAGSTSAGAAHTVTTAGTVTTITAHTPDPSVVGQAITVNFTVTGGATAPTGNVTVSDGAVSCAGALAAGAGTCQLTPTTAGAKTLVATYAGSAIHAGSVSAGVGHTVNTAPTTTTITADTPDPSVTGQPVTVNFTVTGGPTVPTGNVTVSDGTVNCVGALVSGAGSCQLVPTTAGAKTLTATYAGDATHSSSVSAGAAHTVNAASTTTTITADTPDPSTVGVAYTVNFSVAAVAPGTGTPTGTVSVSDGTGASCGPATLAAGAGTCQLTSTTVGAKSLVATYTPANTSFLTSTSVGVPHTVITAGATVTITSHTPNPSVVGQPYTVNVTVTGGATTPTGTVTVTDGGQSCPAPITLAAGAGSCVVTSTSPGAKTLLATYSGDATHAGGSGTAPHTVNQASTTTTISSDLPDPSVVGQTITVSYAVAVTAPGAGTPTGNVTVSDGTDGCTGTVAAGTCSFAATTAGAKNISASYVGDANFTGSTSANAAHTVNAASTTTTITADTPDPSTAGVAYTVNFTVAAVAPGAGTPTGTVSVSDGTGASCGPATLTAGAGTCQLTSTTVGAKTLVATYTPANTSFLAGTSVGEPHTVNASGSTVVINSDTPDPSVVGQGYTVTVTVSGGATTPTGTVTVSDGGQSCPAPITLAAGTGSCILTSTSVGAKTLTATYSGDATHTTGGGTTTHTVNQAATTTSISSDNPDPSVVGQPIVVNYAVAVTAPGAGTPTGNVTVSDGAASCVGTVATGTCSFAATSAGAKNIVATYVGDANFITSASANAAHAVNAASTTTTITGDTPDPSTAGAAYTVNFTAAAVAPGAGTPTGTVSVSDGAGGSCGPITLSGGAGSCPLTSITSGAKTLTATYTPANTSFLTSTSIGEPHGVNAAGSTVTITSDTPDPSVVGQGYTVSVTVSGGTTPTGTVTVSDGGVSCPGPITLSGGTGSCVLTSTSVGTKTLTATYSGDASNSGGSGTAAHTVNQAATTTSISSDNPDPSVVGQTIIVNYAVAVTAPGVGTPTGNVNVSDGTAGCTGTAAAGTCSFAATSAGAKNIAATYVGDANFSTSTSPNAAHTVNAASTTTTITADTPDPSTAGVAYTVNFSVAAVVPGAGTPTGTVSVSDGTGASCGPATLTAGAGTCQLTSITIGTKSLVATYTPANTSFLTSTSVGEPHTVNASGSTVVINSDSPDPSAVGQGYTVTVTVSGGATTPTGTVTVSDGSVSCPGPITLSGGTGSCVLASTTIGAKTLTATYSGDATHSGGSGNALHTVNQAATTTSISSDTPDPSVVGQPIVVNYAVAVTAPGTGTPTGNVTVSDGAASCVGTVATGTCSFAATSAGAKNIVATYVGDANFITSASANAAHTVNAASTTTTITGDTPDPSTAGAAYTVNFTVAAVAPGAGTPTGTVSVSDGAGGSCGPATLTAGAGTCQLTSTTSGSKTLVATYTPANTSFLTSTSAGESHGVNAAGATVTITSDTPDPSVVGQGYTVSVTVSGGSGTPTGTVAMSDGSVSCPAPITLAAGTGSCVLTSTSVGNKTLTATYSGDGSYAGNSGTAGHVVNQATTTTTITSDTPDPSTVNTAYTVVYSVVANAPGAGTPAGNVTVSDGTDNNTCTVAVGQCSLTSTTLGAKTLTATYAGNANFSGSASAGTPHQVDVAGTVTTITSDNPDPSVVGQQITVNFSVTGAPGTPTGSVTVTDGTINCNGPLNGAGTGSCNLTFTTAGNRTLTATYGGDATHGGSGSAGASHAVNAAGTTTTITSDTPDPSTVNVAYTVGYTVVANAPGAGTPAGNVTVSDGTGAQNTCTVAAGSCSLTSTTTGAKTLTATYAGTTNFNGSTSAGAPHQVDAVATTTTVGSSQNPSTFGTSVTWTATVTSGSGTPTGSVQFQVGGVNFGSSVNLNGSGQAAIASSATLAAGNHAVAAIYTATGNFGNSNGSLAGGQTVNQASTLTGVVSSADPSVFGQSVTFTATVTSGAGTPTGNVQFVVAGSNFGSPVALSGGQATSGATSALAIGGHTVSANFLGSTNFAISNGSIGSDGQTVNQAQTTTLITAHDPDPSTGTEAITVQFTVTPVGPGAGTPAGNVTVSASTGGQCTASVATGQCALTPADGTPGTIQLTAVYDGNTNFAGSTSASADHGIQ